MIERYKMFATYNTWCNGRLYDAAEKLSDAEYRKDRGAFFKSVHGTLNHLLLGDRLWMKRLTGEGPVITELDEILYEDFAPLRDARLAEDIRISDYIDSLNNEKLKADLVYRTVVNPKTIRQPLHFALDHFFNHQTHHRGQAHALISPVIGNDATPSFDLIIMQRQTGLGGVTQSD